MDNDNLEKTEPRQELIRVEPLSAGDLEEFNIVELEERLEFTSMLDDLDVVCGPNTNCFAVCACPPK